MAPHFAGGPVEMLQFLREGRISILNPPMTDDERDEQFYRDTESVARAKLDDRQLAMLEPLASEICR
jgi:hypothetical protein